MTIKYNDDVKFTIFGLGFGILFAAALFFIKFYSDFNLPGKIFLIVFFALLAVFYLKSVISIGRTITLNENGCTICLFWYKKTYSWNEFSVKRIESYREPITVIPRGNFKWNGVILYPHKTIKLKKFNPEIYLLFFAFFPFSYVFISLIPSKIERYQGSYAGLKFQANEDEFFSKMEEWNVYLEDCR